MNRRILSLTAFASLACVLTIACQSKPQTTGMFTSRVQAASKSVANDYTKPYLTDEKMNQFLASMKEEHNPFEAIFKPGGQMRNPADLASQMEQFNTFAHKYGFQDYQDYTAVCGRILAAQMQMWAAAMVKESADGFQKMIDSAQADLKKPNLSPEVRKMDEEQIANMQKAISDMNKSGSKSTLNDADMEMVKKYKDQIEQAQKKYKTGM